MLYIEGAVEEDLEWWIEALESWNGALIRVKTPEIQITMDPSSSCWGGIVLNSNNMDLMSGSNLWSRMISHKPSNYLELLAIIVTLESFSDQLQDNQMRGQSSGLAKLAQPLWVLCYKLNITLLFLSVLEGT